MTGQLSSDNKNAAKPKKSFLGDGRFLVLENGKIWKILLPFFGGYGIVKIVKEVFDICFVLYYNHNTNTCLDGGLGYGER